MLWDKSVIISIKELKNTIANDVCPVLETANPSE